MPYFIFPGYGGIMGGPLTKILQSSSTLATSLAISATGAKIAMNGRMRWTDYGTHAISTVSFLPGTVVSAGGSSIDLSLQDTSLTVGPPLQPDETKDQTSNFALNTLSSNTWASKTLGSNRTIQQGELLSVVWEFDAGGRLGADSLIINGLSAITNTTLGSAASTLKTGGTWGEDPTMSNVIFTATDGTIGTLSESAPCSSASSITINSGSATQDEIAIGVQYPFTCKLSGVFFNISLAAGTSDVEIILYDGTTALNTTTLDGNVFNVAASDRLCFVLFTSNVILNANTLYRIGIRPTTTNNITLRYFDVNDANHLNFWLGKNFHYWTRIDQGAWGGEVTTRIPWIVPIIGEVLYNRTMYSTLSRVTST